MLFGDNGQQILQKRDGEAKFKKLFSTQTTGKIHNMSYYTTIKVISKDGKPVKSEVSCGGVSKGFTDENTGEISFEMSSNSFYTVYAKRGGKSVSSKVKGGQTVILREN